MYVAMIFHANPWDDKVSVRSARIRPFKSLEAACSIVKKNQKGGYVKQIGKPTPVFHHIGV